MVSNVFILGGLQITEMEGQHNGILKRIKVNKFRSNTTGIKEVNNIFKQDHRLIKQLTRPMLRFESFTPVVADFETANLIGKRPLGRSTRGFR
ncbi:hypothetical protein [Ruegeria conchae]|uniref:hypothetical protein n=1 Tax=Ruegeria conchae TaxID=981384 RepID=UPI0002378B23|nr:hypothetical protein [Ruegeria conchae]